MQDLHYLFYRIYCIYRIYLIYRIYRNLSYHVSISPFPSRPKNKFALALEKTLEEYKAMANMLMEREEGDEVPAIQVCRF